MADLSTTTIPTVPPSATPSATSCTSFDFDGGGGLIGCQSAGEMIQITLRLLAEGLSDADIANIWGGNFMRVMDAQRLPLA